LVLLSITWPSLGQDRPVPTLDTVPAGSDTLGQKPAGAAFGVDTLPGPDSTRFSLQGVNMSEDSLEFPVEYHSVDSMISDFTRQRIHLFGEAEVKYTTITLKAGYIVLDYETSIVTASALRDSIGRLIQVPEFSDGSQTFKADSMRYNFKTEKGIVYDVSSTYNDVVVRGARTKFVSGKEKPPVSPADTASKAEDILYSKNAIFTTCTAPNPHFGVRSQKQKIIPDKLVVVGPSNLEIMGVPTPLWLPFGFFPIAKGRRTGLIFPRDYEYSQQWGFGLRDIGWFFPMGEHFNLTLTGNIYLKGTWGINGYAQYRKRYKYNGSLRLGFDSRRTEDSEGIIDHRNSFGLSWSHNQDRSAHPTATFGGSINLQTSDYRSTVYNDPGNVLPTQLNSNFRFEKRWTDKPYSFSAAFNHSQNTATGNMTINFPTVNFQTQALYPFKRRTGGGRQKWYETVTLRYRGELKNRFQASDTTLFTQETLENAQVGAQHDLSVGTSFKLFRYLNLNPGVSYKEVWYTRAKNFEFDPTPIVEVDTIYNADSSSFQLITDTLAQGTLDTFNIYGFKTFREYNASISLNTQLFGTLNFRKGWLRGVRHVLKPSISFGFAPDYLRTNNFQTIPTDPNNPDILRTVSIFQDGIFGGPPASGQRMALSYSLNNIFEAKYFSKKDSTEKKLKLFDNIIVSGSYNFAADTLKWSQVNVGGTTRLFKGASTFRFNAQFDPYVTDDNGRRINRTAWKENGRLLRFVRATAGFSTRLTVGKIRALFQGQEEEVVEDVRGQRQGTGLQGQQTQPPGQGPGQATRGAGGQEDILSLLENFSINYNLAMNWNGPDSNREPFEVTTHSINLQGRIRLTQYWNINIGSFGYDFRRKDLSYPYLGFSRDLHCWEMGMNVAPTRGTYSFYLRVKPGTLDFLKIPYERNNADAIRAFQ
jgi:hypothetical protein